MSMKSKPVIQLKQEMDSAELQVKLQADKDKRGNDFKKYLEEGLKKYNCQIDPTIIITAKGNQSSVNIVPL